VDVVELFSERPLVFCVVNLEAAVWGNAVRTSVRGWEFGTLKMKGKLLFGLDWTQICTKNLSGGKQIRCRVLFKVSDEVLMANRIQLPKYQSLVED
jgi:hypothetical protein